MNRPEELSRFQVWWLASRPKTLPAGIVPVVIGGVLAFGTGDFHAPSFLLALVGSLLIQIGTNLVNDLHDFLKQVDDAERIGPLRVTQTGLATPAQMRRVIALVFGLTLLTGTYLVWRGGVPIAVIGLVSILCGIFYTAGPFPLGYRGLGDIFVLVFFGPVAVGGTYYVITLDFEPWVLLAGIPCGMLSTAILVVNNLRDLDNDRRRGKRTLAVRFGRRFSRCQYVALVVGAALFPALIWLLTGTHPWSLLALLILLPAVGTIRQVLSTTAGPALNHTLEATGRLLGLFGILFAIGWLL